MHPTRLAVLALTLTAAVAAADDSSQKLGLFAGAGYLGGAESHGGALNAGVRLATGRHFAFSFDLGYGLINTPRSAQDRWWLIPSAAFVVPLGRTRIDLGAGLGLGASSGYSNWADYGDAPFDPSWAFQLVPTARGHAMVTTSVSRRLELFARLDVASLLLDGNKIGLREGNPRPTLADTLWINLWLGVQLGVL